MKNRLWNCKNPYQGEFKKVLCVCSAGLLRSPTAAIVLAAEPFNFNTRAVGIDSGHALICVDEVLVEWADEIVCMNKEQAETIAKTWGAGGKKFIVLGISDSFAYRDQRLAELIRTNYVELSKGEVK